MKCGYKGEPKRDSQGWAGTKVSANSADIVVGSPEWLALTNGERIAIAEARYPFENIPMERCFLDSPVFYKIIPRKGKIRELYT
jgi:hypothetical protein